MLEPLAPGLFGIHSTRRMAPGVHIPVRCTIVATAEGVAVHSPLEFSAEDIGEINALGTVKWIVAPNAYHHLFVKRASALWPAFVSGQTTNNELALRA